MENNKPGSEASDGSLINKNKPSRKTLLWILALAIVLSSIFGALFGFMASEVNQSGILAKKLDFMLNRSEKRESEVMKQKVIQEDSAVIDVVEKTSSGVVSIVVSKSTTQRNPFNFPGFFDPFGQLEESPGNGNGTRRVGSGTGFFVSSDGLIATNKHVVSDNDAQYSVITSDGKEHEGKVLARDPINDIAVIKIEGDNYETLDFGDSSNIKIGQTVIAIGNSLGEFSNTVSRGIISGLKRTVTAGSSFGDTERLTNIIQTDAAINPGNSGGPLLDINGEVIGINVAMAQGAQNIAFAIPANQIKKVVDQIKTTGKISTPYIGVRYIPINSVIARQNSLPVNYGALILRGQNMTDFAVIPGSPADKAGLMENDIILEIDGQKLDENHGLAELISQHNAGDEITLKIWRKGDTTEAKVKLEEKK